MLRPKGYAQIIDPDRPLVEYDTVACSHCSAAIFVKPNTVSTVYLILSPGPGGILIWREEPGAGCWKCGGRAICLACYAKGTCRPLAWWLEQQESAGLHLPIQA